MTRRKGAVTEDKIGHFRDKDLGSAYPDTNVELVSTMYSLLYKMEPPVDKERDPSKEVAHFERSSVAKHLQK